MLGIVSYHGLGNSLPDSIHLRRMSTTLDTDANVEHRKSVFAGDEDRLVDFQAKDLGLDEVDGRSVNTNKSTALFGMGNCSSGLQLQSTHANTKITKIIHAFFLPNVCTALADDAIFVKEAG